MGGQGRHEVEEPVARDRLAAWLGSSKRAPAHTRSEGKAIKTPPRPQARRQHSPFSPFGPAIVTREGRDTLCAWPGDAAFGILERGRARMPREGSTRLPNERRYAFSSWIFRALMEARFLQVTSQKGGGMPAGAQEELQMLERLSDLDELILRCRTQEAREHIAEAVASYRGGAYRAAIVMSWIAVVFDLMDKIRDLSIAGEPAATALLKTFETYQQQYHDGARQAMKQALEFEREILQRVARDLSLIDAQQLTDLMRLREDRHRCAHPSFNRVGEAFRPPAELARLHLRNAITHVLSQPPVQGKAALDRLVNLVASEFFPMDRDKAKIQLEANALAHATPALVKSFIDALFFGYIDEDSPLHQTVPPLVVLTILSDTHRAIAEPRIAERFNKLFSTVDDRRMSDAVTFLGDWPASWDMLEPAHRDRVMTFVEGADYEAIETPFPVLTDIPDLVPLLKKRLLGFTTDQLATLLVEQEVPPIAIEAIIARYLEANTFLLARSRRQRLVVPMLEHFTADHISELVARAAENDQVYKESGFSGLLNYIPKLELMPFAAYAALVEKAGFIDLLDVAEGEKAAGE